LRSDSEPIIWFIKANNLQDIGYVDVKDSYAMGNTLYAGQPSRNVSGNTNWIFNYVPGAVSDLVAEAQMNGDVILSWSAPLDADDDPLGSGSQFAIQWSTWSVAYSTSNTGDTGYKLTYHVYIATSGAGSGSAHVYISTGLTGNKDYNFRIWTRDPLGYWSAISNAANATVTPILSVALSEDAYSFGAVNLAASTMSTTVIDVVNTGNMAQTYSLSAAPTGAETVWTLGSAPPTGYNILVLEGLFNSTQPAENAFGDSDVITGTPTPASGTEYAGDQTGVAADVGDTRKLWLKLLMPLTTSTTDQQAVNLTVTAN
jgi:GH24 family phage-related lysozyme (muramidase)